MVISLPDPHSFYADPDLTIKEVSSEIENGLLVVEMEKAQLVFKTLHFAEVARLCVNKETLFQVKEAIGNPLANLLQGVRGYRQPSDKFL